MLVTNSKHSSIMRIILLAIIQLFASNFDMARAQQTPSLYGQSGVASKSFMPQIGTEPAFREYLAGEGISDAPTIELRRKFLGSQKYIYDGKEQSVYGFWGFSFRSEFQQTMSIHPAALQEAKKAYPYRVAGNLGILALAGLSVKIFIDTVSQADDVSSGRLNSGSGGASSGDLLMVAVAGGVSIISGILGKKHLEKGVRMFNEKQTTR